MLKPFLLAGYPRWRSQDGCAHILQFARILLALHEIAGWRHMHLRRTETPGFNYPLPTPDWNYVMLFINKFGTTPQPPS